MNAPKNEAEDAFSLDELDHILQLFEQEAPLPPQLQRKREEFVDHFEMMLIRKKRNRLPYLREVRRRLPDPPRLIPLLRELLLRTFSGTYEASVCTTLVELGQRMVDPAPAILVLLAKFQQILDEHYYDKMTPDHYFHYLRALCEPPGEAAEGEGKGPRRPAGWAPQPAWFAFLFDPQHTQVMEVEEDHPFLDPVWSWRFVLEALVEWFDWIQAPVRLKRL